VLAIACLAALLGVDAGAAPPATAVLPRGRITTIVLREDVGSPIERAVPNDLYQRAALADADGRWEDAHALYRRAADEWTAQAVRQPSAALDLAVAKAEREASRSEELAVRSKNSGFGNRIPEPLREPFRRRQATEEGRLLREKMMATRAALGRLSPFLFARARMRLREAIDPEAPPARNAQLQLWLCATQAVGGDPAAARLARAAVPDVSRAESANAVALAACDTALHEDEAALRALESFILRLPPPRPAELLRDLSLANDWDRLRGTRRFDSLFW
jgi:hypothetical protein